MSAHSRHICPRWLRLTATLFSGLCILLVAAVIFITFWLTPSRLSDIVNRQASRYLDADVRIENLRFTLWSSFPRLCIEADSCSVISRSLDSLPASLAGSLPPDCKALYSSGPFRGGINLVSLFAGRIRLRDLQVERACVNLLAVNDSLANWDIFPTDPSSSSRIPHIYSNLVSLKNIRHIRYRSLSSGLNLCLKPQTATIKALPHSDTYACKFDGRIDAAIPGFTLLSDFPFDLMGDVSLNFNPFKVNFSDFAIGLGNIHAHLSLDFLAESDPKFNSFSFNTDSFKLLTLFGYLPASVIPDLRGLDRSVTVNASARLTRPYTLNSENLPSLALYISLPEGKVDIPLSSPMRLWHSTITARLDFNGDDVAASSLTLSPFDIKGDGMEASFHGTVTDISERPHISSAIDMRGDLKHIGALIPAFGRLKPDGEVSVKAGISFYIPDYSHFAMKDIDIKAEISSPGFAINTEPGRSRLKAGKLRIAISSDCELDNGSFHTSAPVIFNLSAGSASWRRGNTLIAAEKLTVKGNARVLEPDSIFRSLIADVASSDFKVAAPGHTLDFAEVDIDASLRMASPLEKKSLHTDSRPLFADSLWLARTPHLPDVLTVNSPGFAKFVRNWRLGADLRLDSARWDIAGYPYPFALGKTSLWCDFDSIALRRFSISSGASDIALTGSAHGFRALLAGNPMAMIDAELDLKGKTIDINQIAKATDSSDKTNQATDGTTSVSADSVPLPPAWILPRNINALLSLTADRLYYTNLDLENLDSRLVVSGGILHIPYMRLDTGFGRMALNADYDSSDIADLSVSATLALQDLDLSPMFVKFKSLSEKFPQIRNLSGYAALSASVDFDIFPDMTVDMSSLTAQMGVSGRDLVLRQDPFIRKVTRMMLIRHDNPISVADMDIRASVHDNLLELYPFCLDFENYSISMQGLNNFAGDLDYHIGVMHSPVPFPFGINVKGTYHHPSVRFGGAEWKADAARRVSSRIEKSFTWNFVHKMQWAGKILMKKAATGQTF